MAPRRVRLSASSNTPPQDFCRPASLRIAVFKAMFYQPSKISPSLSTACDRRLGTVAFRHACMAPGKAPEPVLIGTIVLPSFAQLAIDLIHNKRSCSVAGSAEVA